MKTFYTDKDIEELHRNGIKSLRVNDDVVLTDLAYEKALQLGLLADDSPPAAPVRPYLSDVKPRHFDQAQREHSTGKVDSDSLTPLPLPLGEGRGEGLEKRIREKVAAKLGTQVDAQLLDAIIKRTLKVTGMK